ncbi:MAG: flagellar biosynthesis anti-sigma factor FlgM [Pseudomonadota bacterium]
MAAITSRIDHPPSPPDGLAAPAGARRPAAAPVLDHARIQAIRTALANGRYLIDPQVIATRLDALERELSR